MAELIWQVVLWQAISCGLYLGWFFPFYRYNLPVGSALTNATITVTIMDAGRNVCLTKPPVTTLSCVYHYERKVIVYC